MGWKDRSTYHSPPSQHQQPIEIKKLIRLYYTIKYLRPVQIYGRFLFPLKVKRAEKKLLQWSKEAPAPHIPGLQPTIESPESYVPNGQFRFLNIAHVFEEKVDWNIINHGKLWQYNLRYFDYVRQPDLPPEAGLALIDDFIENIEQDLIEPEPYPVSLRCINWIHFLVKHNIAEKKYWDWLYAQFCFLEKTLEVHLQANHLLENYLALAWGAAIFNKQKWIHKSENDLVSEIEHQILKDGAHYELSPMYHAILLYRMMDVYNLLATNEYRLPETQKVLGSKIPKMLSWLNQMIVSENHWPCFNDSVGGVAPTLDQLNEYANRLGFCEQQNMTLAESGYRVLENNGIQLLVDVGSIGVSYQPGHVHCDMLSFECYYKNVPVLVNSGISTYEAGVRRSYERSTTAHNTVQVGDLEQSDVWSAFRVGKRAKCVIGNDFPDLLSAYHDGFGKNIHEREWRNVPGGWRVTDYVKPKGSQKAKAYYHIHHEINIKKINETEFKIGNLILSFENAIGVTIESFDQAAGFNHLFKSKRLVIEFKNQLVTLIITAK